MYILDVSFDVFLYPQVSGIVLSRPHLRYPPMYQHFIDMTLAYMSMYNIHTYFDVFLYHQVFQSSVSVLFHSTSMCPVVHLILGETDALPTKVTKS